jgi:GR25 family glycosyltransferase involved in LPS biosynthesis
MKAYCINLDRRPERMESFNKNNLPFEIERVSGIDMDMGNIGCTLSHFKLLRTQTEFPFIIFEDDCVFIEPWSLVEKAMRQLPKDWDALWLGATLDTQLKRYSENLFRLNKAYCTHAIIYNSKRMVDYILQNFKGFNGRKIIDVFYYEDVQKRFNCYITYPLTTVQAPGVSDVMKRMPDDSEYQWRIDCYNKFTREV